MFTPGLNISGTLKELDLRDYIDTDLCDSHFFLDKSHPMIDDFSRQKTIVKFSDFSGSF